MKKSGARPQGYLRKDILRGKHLSMPKGSGSGGALSGKRRRQSVFPHGRTGLSLREGAGQARVPGGEEIRSAVRVQGGVGRSRHRHLVHDVRPGAGGHFQIPCVAGSLFVEVGGGPASDLVVHARVAQHGRGGFHAHVHRLVVPVDDVRPPAPLIGLGSGAAFRAEGGQHVARDGHELIDAEEDFPFSGRKAEDAVGVFHAVHEEGRLACGQKGKLFLFGQRGEPGAMPAR